MTHRITATLLTAMLATSLSGCISENEGSRSARQQEVHVATANLVDESRRRRTERANRERRARERRRSRARFLAGLRSNHTTNCLIAGPQALAVAADALEDRKSIKRFLPKDGSSSKQDQKKLFETMGVENVYGSGGGGGC